MLVAMESHTRHASGLFGWLALVGLVGGIGTLASIHAAVFYQGLDRPSWAPPASVFGPVWTLLYVAMAVAAWIVWKERGWAGARGPLALFCSQLLFNAMWSWLFFAWRQGALALADIVVMSLLILATSIAFFRVRRIAGLLMLPYLAWVTFAAFLNYSVWQRNPGLLG